MLGIGTITICDLDVIEEVNLSRSILFRDCDIGKSKALCAAARARDINPRAAIEGVNCDVIYEFGSARYREFDCVITTVDNLEARMWINRYCKASGTPLIDTGIQGGSGNVFVSGGDKGGPCLECLWRDRNYDALSDKYSCLTLGLVMEEPKIPMVITSASVVAGMAAHECVRLLHDRAENIKSSNAGFGRWFSLDEAACLSWRHERRERCPGCEMEGTLGEVLTYHPGRREQVETVKAKLANDLFADAVELWFDKEMVYSYFCRSCKSINVSSPIALGRFRWFRCTVCGELDVVAHDWSHELRGTFTLQELGVPEYHYIIVDYRSNGETRRGHLLVV